jgi:hypothetical protein
MLLNFEPMHSSPIPWKVLASDIGVGILTDGWTLDVPDAGITDSREFLVDIVFASSFAVAPVVQLGLTGFDIDQRDTSRITLKAQNITESGFQAVIATWAATRVYSVEFNWLAIGP